MIEFSMEEIEELESEYPGDSAFDLDMRLSPHLNPVEELGLGPAFKSPQREAANIILTHLAFVGWSDPHRWTFFSRDRNVYSQNKRYRSPALSCTHVINVIDVLKGIGLIEEERAAPSPDGKYRSRMRLLDGVDDMIPVSSIVDLRFIPAELVKRKDDKKRLVNYNETSQTRRMRRELVEHNEAVSQLKLFLNSPDWHLDDRGLLRSMDRVLNPAKLSLYRIFNTSWRHGGRVYGGFWQRLPRVDRTCLRIDDEETVEPDFEYLHPQMMATMAGIDLQNEDPYRIDGFSRKLVKAAFNTMLNANTPTAAYRAILNNLRTVGARGLAAEAQALIEAIKIRHPYFSRFWGTGLGLRLQALDADMCVRVIARMRSDGVVALPVHDSFIVPKTAKGLAQEVMEEELTKTLREIRNNPLKIL